MIVINFLKKITCRCITSILGESFRILALFFTFRRWFYYYKAKFGWFFFYLKVHQCHLLSVFFFHCFICFISFSQMTTIENIKGFHHITKVTDLTWFCLFLCFPSNLDENAVVQCCSHWRAALLFFFISGHVSGIMHPFTMTQPYCPFWN